MSGKYQELSELYNRGIEKYKAHEQVCIKFVRLFANGLLKSFQWPEELVSFVPLEGNPYCKPTESISVGLGPSTCIHFQDGSFRVGLRLLIYPPTVSSGHIFQESRYYGILPEIKVSSTPAYALFSFAGKEDKLDHQKPDFEPLYQEFERILRDALENYKEGTQVSHFGFRPMK